MTWKLLDLPWLPAATEDFRPRCKAIPSLPEGEREKAARVLAGHALAEGQLNTLAGILPSLPQGSGLVPFRLGVVGNGTLDLLIRPLAATALRHGLRLEVVTVPYGRTMTDLLSPDSQIHRARCDAILLAFDHRGLPLSDGVGKAIEFVESARRAARLGGVGTVILQTLAEPPESLFGNYDLRLPHTSRRLVLDYNRALADHLSGGDLLFDVGQLAARVGLDAWHDPGLWFHGKIGISPHIVPLWADHLARLLAAMRGKSRKCLVLDLDNTLWGGVIGDDGLNGIELGPGSPRGEAHYELQRLCLDLRERGIVLAVCSKNNDDVARQPFAQHPEMLLKEDHIAVFVANWRDKASNLEHIAASLNIGVDALVFLDDNPAERAQVREELPQVAVPEVGADPAYFARTLASAGYFEAIAFSDEDRFRADQYRANAMRQNAMAESRDLGAYLRSLEMTFTVAPFRPVDLARITQLINKSNQFNLSTRRYTEAEVTALAGEDGVFTLSGRLRDRFGDNGLITVLIARDEGEDWIVDTWLMSCRVLGRRVEEACLAVLVAHARAAGKRRLIGRFVPSGRNELVRDHYRKLGFAPFGEEDGAMCWSLEVADYVPPELPIQVESHFEEGAA